MTENTGDKVDLYLFRLEKALGLPPERAAEVVEEVRADVEARVERGKASGHSDEEVVEEVLGELGPPHALAKSMRGELPPFGGKGVTVLRYVVAGVLIVWTGFFLWAMRSWTYGPDPVVTGLVVFLHLPAILLAWPRIVWRRSWLFGLIPAGVLVAGVLIAATAGVESTVEIGPVDLTEGEVVLPEPVASSEPARWPAVLVASTMALVSTFLLLAMQQRAQRLRVGFFVVAGLVLLEGPFLIEESAFRKDRDEVAALMVRAGQEGEPDEEQIESLGLRNDRAIVRMADGEFTLFWSRPLSRGFAIVYSSADDEVWVND